MAKRYYWLKLKDDFFEDKTTKILRSMPDGDNLVIIYLKMQLKSLKTEGILQYTKILPSNVEELSVLLDEDVNNIRLLLETLKRLNCIEELEDGSLYMLAMQDLVGSESSWAQYKRKGKVENEKLENFQSVSKKLPTDIDIEKDIEIDIEKDINSCCNNNKYSAEIELFSSNNILITSANYEKTILLIDEYSIDWIKEAITRACIQGNRNLNYVEGILRSWKNKGFVSIDDIQKEYKKKETAEEKVKRVLGG